MSFVEFFRANGVTEPFYVFQQVEDTRAVYIGKIDRDLISLFRVPTSPGRNDYVVIATNDINGDAWVEAVQRGVNPMDWLGGFSLNVPPASLVGVELGAASFGDYDNAHSAGLRQRRIASVTCPQSLREATENTERHQINCSTILYQQAVAHVFQWRARGLACQSSSQPQRRRSHL